MRFTDAPNQAHYVERVLECGHIKALDPYTAKDPRRLHWCRRCALNVPAKANQEPGRTLKHGRASQTQPIGTRVKVG